MEFSEDFVLPEIEVTTKPVPEVQANDDAFYAAGSYGTDPVNNYTQMYGELTQQGYSQSLEDAEKLNTDDFRGNRGFDADRQKKMKTIRAFLN